MPLKCLCVVFMSVFMAMIFVMVPHISAQELTALDEIQRDTTKSTSSAPIVPEEEKNTAEPEGVAKGTTRKVAKKIAAVPETTGNLIKEHLDTVGTWVEDKSGQRIEMKWNPPREKGANPWDTADAYGLERDPASGT